MEIFKADKFSKYHHQHARSEKTQAENGSVGSKEKRISHAYLINMNVVFEFAKVVSPESSIVSRESSVVSGEPK